ncbi:MAG: transporter permease [Chlorobi bacterium]|nr:transporter permease [Chlorobiota bacterium]
MNRGRIGAIARWEYLQKVRSKGFIISLLLTPLIVILSTVLPAYFADQPPDATVAIGVIDRTGLYFAELKQGVEATDKLRDGNPAYLLANYLPGNRPYDSAIALADRDALAGKIEGVILLWDSAGTPRVDYRSTSPNNVRVINNFGRSIRKLITVRRLMAAGIDTALYSRISRDIDVEPVKISKSGKAESTGFLQTFFTAYACCFLLMFLVLTTGQSLVRSLVEEKTNRIMELLIGNCTPQELMWGKLIGLSGLGLTQMVIWVILGLGFATSFVTQGAGVIASLKGVYAILPLMLTYIFLGYIFYAALFIGIGSLVTNEQEAQVTTSVLTMALVLPIFVALGVIQNPEMSYIRILSYIPLFTPSMMMIRAVTRMPSAGEIIGTIGVMLLATSLVVWAAGKIFRVAILLYGKRPSFGEIIKWLRAE